MTFLFEHLDIVILLNLLPLDEWVLHALREICVQKSIVPQCMSKFVFMLRFNVIEKLFHNIATEIINMRVKLPKIFPNNE